MAVVSESKIREEIQRKKPRGFYVLVGEDLFKQDHYANSLASVALPPEGKKEVLYGDELDPTKLLDEVRTPSLWDPQKFLLVRQGERISAKQWEALLPLLKDSFDRCTLVIQCAKADGRTKFFQALGKAEERVALVKLDPASASEASFWLQSFLREAGKGIDDAARELLLEWMAGSLSDLKHSVARAALFAGEESVILKSHVQAVCFRLSPEDVFRFTGQVLAGDRAEALQQLETLLGQGEEPLALIGLLSRQYRWLLMILSLRAEGKADQAIATEAGIFPAAARALFPASRRLGGKRVVRGLSSLAAADHSLKSSRMPKDQVLTSLVLELTS